MMGKCPKCGVDQADLVYLRRKVKGVKVQRAEFKRQLAQRDEQIAGQREALLSMVVHFAYWSEPAGGYMTGGLSALEEAFDVLGWDDPHPEPEARCDEPGCMAQATCGISTRDSYRRVCGDHFRAIDAAAAKAEQKR